MNSSWKLFVLGRNKTPLPNCAACRIAGPTHDAEACECLTCHGFYAATDDQERLRAMASRYPNHEWAVRCGAASGIIVLDAEGDGLPSGVDVLDAWEQWTGGLTLPLTELIAHTPSGGVHRYYRYEPGTRSRNRVLPGVDLKADGGYVVLPLGQLAGAGQRRWILSGEPGVLDEKNLEFLRRRGVRGGAGVGIGGGGVVGHSTGYDYDTYVRDGCPGGVRDEFFNELIFRLRKAGLPRDRLVVEVRHHWSRCAQPPEAKWYMPWRHVDYKIERIWRTVAVDDVAEELLAWARQAQANVAVGERRVGRVTLAGKGEAR